MLVWATEIPLRAESTAGGVLALAQRWLTGSPHSQWAASQIPCPSVGEMASASINNETVSVARVENDTGSWIGFKYIRTEYGTTEWTTEIVAFQRKTGVLASIQLHCELLGASPAIPRPKKPYFVRQILAEYGGGSDAGIPICDTPLILREADVDLAARIVSGKFNNHLPIIYASSTRQNMPAINAVTLAQWAGGLAHVVVEPSRAFSLVLARNTDRQNVYGGAIGIYWPKHHGMREILRPESYSSPARLATATADLVRRALLNCRPTIECTWDYLQELMSRQRLDALKASGSREIEEYIHAFDAENSAKDQHIEKLDREAIRLRVELQRAEGMAEVARRGIIRAGKEQPFYPGEIRDAILKAIEAGKAQLFPDGRCRHIIDDILQANHLSQDESDLFDEIKRILTTCENLGREQQKGLEQLGFSFDTTGKHIEATYHDDPRYSFTMPKTGSDWRGMKNQASDIVKKLFR